MNSQRHITPSPAYKCYVCQNTPIWRLTRKGDLLTTWACVEHINEALSALQLEFATEIILLVHNDQRPNKEIQHD